VKVSIQLAHSADPRRHHAHRHHAGRHDPIARKCGKGMVTQAILFPRTKYTPGSVKSWLHSHGYSVIKPIHTTKGFHRARLLPPSSVHTLRTVRFGKGIEAVVGCPRR